MLIIIGKVRASRKTYKIFDTDTCFISERTEVQLKEQMKNGAKVQGFSLVGSELKASHDGLLKYAYYGETPQTAVIVGFDAASDTVKVITSSLNDFICSYKEIRTYFNEYCISTLLDNGMIDKFKEKSANLSVSENQKRISSYMGKLKNKVCEETCYCGNNDKDAFDLVDVNLLSEETLEFSLKRVCKKCGISSPRSISLLEYDRQVYMMSPRIYAKYGKELQSLKAEVDKIMSDVSNYGGIRLVCNQGNKLMVQSSHNEITRYIYGPEATLDFSEIDSLSKRQSFAAEYKTHWMEYDNPEALASFKRFIEQGETYGWD